MTIYQFGNGEFRTANFTRQPEWLQQFLKINQPLPFNEMAEGPISPVIDIANQGWGYMDHSTQRVASQILVSNTETELLNFRASSDPFRCAVLLGASINHVGGPTPKTFFIGVKHAETGVGTLYASIQLAADVDATWSSWTNGNPHLRLYVPSNHVLFVNVPTLEVGETATCEFHHLIMRHGSKPL